MMFASKNSTAREECIKSNIEFYCRINLDDVNFEYYLQFYASKMSSSKTESKVQDKDSLSGIIANSNSKFHNFCINI